MHVLPGRVALFGTRPLPDSVPKKTLCATGNYTWRRKVGLSSIFDPKGIDVTQNTPFRANRSRPSLGAERLNSCGASGQRDQSQHQLDANACEDLPRLPWLRTQPTQSFDEVAASQVPPTRVEWL